MVSVRMVEWAEEYPFLTIARLEDRSIWALSLTWNLSNELPAALSIKIDPYATMGG